MQKCTYTIGISYSVGFIGMWCWISATRARRDSCYPWTWVAPPTWLWMYLVCRPCSSSLVPSTSCLYPGLITTMISTDFWGNTFHQRSAFRAYGATDWALVSGTYIVQKSVHPFSGVHYSGCVVKDVDLRWNALRVFVKYHWETNFKEPWQLTAGSNPWSVRNLTKWIISLAVSTEYVMKTLPVKQKRCIELTRALMMGGKQTAALRPTAFLW